MSAVDPANAEPVVAVDVVRGDPTPEEVAALVAVVGEAYAQEAQYATDDAAPRSRWELSARSLRVPLARERGWTGFSG